MPELHGALSGPEKDGLLIRIPGARAQAVENYFSIGVSSRLPHSPQEPA